MMVEDGMVRFAVCQLLTVPPSLISLSCPLIPQLAAPHCDTSPPHNVWGEGGGFAVMGWSMRRLTALICPSTFTPQSSHRRTRCIRHALSVHPRCRSVSSSTSRAEATVQPLPPFTPSSPSPRKATKRPFTPATRAIATPTQPVAPPSPLTLSKAASTSPTFPPSLSHSSVSSWGSGAFGGLGCSSYRPHPSPTVVPSLSFLPSPVISLASGWTSNLALTGDGSLYHWGYKPFLRSLSFTAKLHNRVPNILSAFQSLNLGRWTLSNAITTPSPLAPFSPSQPAVRISCGGDYAAVVDAEGRLWTFGSNFFGQLGHSQALTDALVNEPKVVQALVDAGLRVKEVACGFHHLLILTEEGSVYVCGKHDHGALGLGKIYKEGKRLYYPHLVPGTALSASSRLSLDPTEGQHTVASLIPPPHPIGEVVQVSGGMKHSLLLTREGRVYASGHNQFGQCGFSPLDISATSSTSPSSPASASTFLSLSTFTRVSALRHERIIAVSAGQHHSLFLSSTGRVFACGLNQQGQCGQSAGGSTLRQSSALSSYTQRQFECVAEPREVEVARGFECVGVRAGFYDSALLGRDGRVTWWGGKMQQQGGKGKVAGVMAGKTVRDVSFGFVHSLLLTEEEEGPTMGVQSGSPTASDPRPSWY